MSITYTPGWSALWRSVYYIYFAHPYRLHPLLFLLLPLPFLVWMGADLETTVRVTGIWAGGSTCFILLFAVSSAVECAGKPYTLIISQDELRAKTCTPTATVKWRRVIRITYIEGDTIIFGSAWTAGFFVSASAFADFNQAQQFYEQAVFYWCSATGRTPPAMNMAGVWPPAPRLGNSAEPGDGREG